MQTSSQRIETLDNIRGIAILGIVLMNIPAMLSAADYLITGTGDDSGFVLGMLLSDSFGAGRADRWTYWAVTTLFQDSMRGMLFILFGASILLFAKRALTPDGPVAVADIFWRRMKWLIGLGLFHATALLWPGEILVEYGLAGLLSFQMRLWRTRSLAIFVGLVLALVSISGAIGAHGAYDKQQVVQTAIEKDRSGIALGSEEKEALDSWKARTDPAALRETNADIVSVFQQSSYPELVQYVATSPVSAERYSPVIVFGALEPVTIFALGMILFRIGYFSWPRGKLVKLALASYAISLPVIGAATAAQIPWSGAPLSPLPVTAEIVAGVLGFVPIVLKTIGHLSVLLVLSQTVIGARILGLFRATGLMAMSTYLMQSLIICVILAPGYGFGLFGKLSYWQMIALCLPLFVLQIAFAHWWLKSHPMGPSEWLIRWGSYARRPPWRRPPGSTTSTPQRPSIA